MNTPRTDLESQLTVISCEDSCIETYVYREGDLYSGDIVTADFARQLEAELQNMTALAERLAEAMKNSCNFPGCKNWHPESDNAIAAYEAHKKQTP